MKRFEQFTDEELINLPVDDISNLIELECAYEGIPMLPQIPVEIVKPDVQKEHTIYTVAGVSVQTQAEAIKLLDVISNLNLVKIDYNWSVGSDNKYYMPITSDDYNYPKIEVSKVLSKEDYSRLEESLRDYATTQKQYETDMARYNEIKKQRDSITDSVYERINTILRHKQEVEDYIEKFNHYLELADGNRTIALKFLSNSYPEVINYPDVLKYAKTAGIDEVLGEE
jgi:hypothetical protein